MFATTITALLLLLGPVSTLPEDHVIRCGTSKLADKNLLRSGTLADGVEPGALTARKDQPWIVLLQYGDGKRDACVGTLISDRHVLTARLCVDTAGPHNRSEGVIKPSDITVFFGHMDSTSQYPVKSIRIQPATSEGYIDLAVLEIKKVELNENVRPICVATSFLATVNRELDSFYWKPKEGTGPSLKASDPALVPFDRCRGIRQTHPFKPDESDYYCVYKKDLLGVEGVFVGGPVMEQDDASARWLQVGILAQTDEDHTAGLVTRVVDHAELIRNLTDCYLIGSGVDTVQTADFDYHCKGETMRPAGEPELAASTLKRPPASTTAPPQTTSSNRTCSYDGRRDGQPDQPTEDEEEESIPVTTEKPPKLDSKCDKAQGPSLGGRTCTVGMDLMIVVDVSGTMKNSIDDAKTFARSVVDGLKLGTNDEQTRVGIAQFSNDVQILANFSATREDLTKAIDKMEGDNGHTKTEKALNFTLETFREGARDPLKLVPKVAVLVTDGNADNGQGEDQARPGALAAAERVKKDGEITLIVVGLKGQQGIDEKELSKMASPNSFYKVDSAKDLAERFPSILLNKTCHESTLIPQNTTTVKKGLNKCQSTYMRIPVNTSTGATLKLRARSGELQMLLSISTVDPSTDDYDGSAKCGNGTSSSIDVTPAQLKRSGTLPDDDDNVATKGSVVHLRAADASPNGTRDVYVRITGEEAKISGVAYRNTTKFGRLAGKHTYQEAEQACLQYHGSIPAMADSNNAMYLASALQVVPQLRTTGRTWIFQGDPTDRKKLRENVLEFNKCHALDLCKATIVEHDCSATLVSICEVPRKEAECSSTDLQYFNGSCYKYVRGDLTALKAQEECGKAGQGYELAVVESEEEEHYVQQIVDEYASLTRLGNHAKDKSPYGNVQCKSGEYPWCAKYPSCAGDDQLVSLRPSTHGGCWKDGANDHAHSSICERKLPENVGPN